MPPDPVLDQGVLTRWLARSARLSNPRLIWWLAGVLGLLASVCVLAAFTRGSAVPLLPLPFFALGALFLWKMREKVDQPALLVRWASAFLVVTLTGFGVLSLIARIVDRSSP